MQLQVREARLTDIDRIIGLLERADARWTVEKLTDAADVLRQLVYLANATLIVALDGRMLLGVAVLALRPSVSAAGLVGAIDLLAVEPGHEPDGVVEALLGDLQRQARNKGCVVLEGNAPEDPNELARWGSMGFSEAGPRLQCPLVRTVVPSW